ncbi:hypothetical protein BD770DRAFT_405916 [Pilaira anomala]|nr:hypothetical protein BD770DRAFT_405916 [Pilaira anomala]
MSFRAYHLGKSLEHSSQAKVFRIANKEINRFVDTESNEQHTDYNPFDMTFKFLVTDETHQENTLCNLNFSKACTIAGVEDNFHFKVATEEKRRTYDREEYFENDSWLINISQQFTKMNLKKRASERCRPLEEPLFTGPSLLEKLAGKTKAEMTCDLEKKRDKYESYKKRNTRINSA